MTSHIWNRVALVLILSVAGAIPADAQSGWPTRRAAGVSAPAKPANVRKARTSSTRKPPRRAPVAQSKAAREADLLRSMAELVTRQAEAIEALARRLEAAEARLEVLASAALDSPAGVEATASTTPPALTQLQTPFEAGWSIDWADVIASR